MKAAPFDYVAPESLAEAVSLLASRKDDAKLLAGGQSLLPVMAFRLAAPALLVDLRRIAGLDEITIAADGVRLGARVRWRDIEDDRRLPAAHPLLAAAVAHIAHYQIRNRGTVGGSLAHADPAAEMPGICVTCEADISIVGPSGTRIVRADDFFVGPLATILRPDEIIVEIHLPAWAARRRWDFAEFARRRGDFAIAGVALFYDETASGTAKNAHVGVIGACDRPHRLTAVEAMLNGRAIDEGTLVMAASVASESLNPPNDLHASAAYRRSLVATLVERALRRAMT